MTGPVLVVEDEAAIALVLREALTDEGFAVETVPDGLSARLRLQRPPLPGLILLDLALPGLAGRDLLAAIRADPGLRGIPVVLITGAVTETADFPPADSYQALIAKPFDLAAVLATVRELLRPPPGAR